MCDNYVLDMSAASFGVCKCGEPKSSHGASQQQPNKAPKPEDLERFQQHESLDVVSNSNEQAFIQDLHGGSDGNSVATYHDSGSVRNQGKGAESDFTDDDIADFCMKCGEEALEGAYFCFKCGTSLKLKKHVRKSLALGKRTPTTLDSITPKVKTNTNKGSNPKPPVKPPKPIAPDPIVNNRAENSKPAKPNTPAPLLSTKPPKPSAPAPVVNSKPPKPSNPPPLVSTKPPKPSTPAAEPVSAFAAELRKKKEAYENAKAKPPKPSAPAPISSFQDDLERFQQQDEIGSFVAEIVMEEEEERKPPPVPPRRSQVHSGFDYLANLDSGLPKHVTPPKPVSAPRHLSNETPVRRRSGLGGSTFISVKPPSQTPQAPTAPRKPRKSGTGGAVYFKI